KQALEPPRDVVIDLPKLDRSIAGAEVGGPSAQHRVELRDCLAQPPVTRAAVGDRLHALANPAHRTIGRPSLQEVHAAMVPLPQWAAHALAQMTAEEVKALASVREIDLPRFVRMQLQAERREDRADTWLGALTRRLRVAHDHEVVRIAHQHPEMREPARP